MLDHIHNRGLRLALGDFRPSPDASLYLEADEPSLYLPARSSLSLPLSLSLSLSLSLQYAIRLAANPSNSAHKFSFPPKLNPVIFKILLCFIFVSAYNMLYIFPPLDTNTDRLTLYTVQFKNIYSRLNRSLKLRYCT